jgi:hypothetical protein
MEWHEIIISILSGLAATIPLAIQLVKWIGKAIEEKNWHNLVNLVMNLMAEAEGKFDNGADRKEWVLSMVEASAKTINYPIDIEAVGTLIDDLCAMSKLVNAPKTEE